MSSQRNGVKDKGYRERKGKEKRQKEKSKKLRVSWLNDMPEAPQMQADDMISGEKTTWH